MMKLRWVAFAFVRFMLLLLLIVSIGRSESLAHNGRRTLRHSLRNCGDTDSMSGCEISVNEKFLFLQHTGAPGEVFPPIKDIQRRLGNSVFNVVKVTLDLSQFSGMKELPPYYICDLLILFKGVNDIQVEGVETLTMTSFPLPYESNNGCRENTSDRFGSKVPPKKPKLRLSLVRSHLDQPGQVVLSQYERDRSFLSRVELKKGSHLISNPLRYDLI